MVDYFPTLINLIRFNRVDLFWEIFLDVSLNDWGASWRESHTTMIGGLNSTNLSM